MSRQLVDVVEYLDMVDEIYLEEDGTYFHDIYYKEGKQRSDTKDQRKIWMSAVKAK